jgi:hypothetical protein
VTVWIAHRTATLQYSRHRPISRNSPEFCDTILRDPDMLRWIASRSEDSRLIDCSFPSEELDPPACTVPGLASTGIEALVKRPRRPAKGLREKLFSGFC